MQPQWKVSPSGGGLVRVDVAGRVIEILPRLAESFGVELIKVSSLVAESQVISFTSTPSLEEILKKILKENEKCDCGERLVCPCGQFVDEHSKKAPCARIGMCQTCDQS